MFKLNCAVEMFKPLKNIITLQHVILNLEIDTDL